MAASIDIRFSRSDIVPELQSYDLVVEALSATDMPTKIFIYQRTIPMPGADPINEFVCLADPVDLEEIPEDSPDLANEMPYFRVDKATLRFRSMQILEETKGFIQADVRTLVEALIAAENTPIQEDVTYG